MKRFKIFVGRDNYNRRPLYQVIDKVGDYVGEFHKSRKEAQEELKDLMRSIRKNPMKRKTRKKRIVRRKRRVMRSNPIRSSFDKPTFGPFNTETRRVNTTTMAGMREAEKLRRAGWYQGPVTLFSTTYYRKRALPKSSIARQIRGNSRRAFPTPRFVGKGEYIWKQISRPQRMNFLMESFTNQITDRDKETLAGRAWSFLPSKVKIVFSSKVANVELNDYR